MEENQIQTETPAIEPAEPGTADNSASGLNEGVSIRQTNTGEEEVPVTEEGQSDDPSEELILGKFKSVGDLTKAYEELQKYQGSCSEELGQLRKVASEVSGTMQAMSAAGEYYNDCLKYLKEVNEKYDKPEYFQDSTFVRMYVEAFKALNCSLDTDIFVELLDNYVSSRVNAHDKMNLANDETRRILDSMDYNKNPKTSFTPPKKRLDEMTQQEVDNLLDRLI